MPKLATFLQTPLKTRLNWVFCFSPRPAVGDAPALGCSALYSSDRSSIANAISVNMAPKRASSSSALLAASRRRLRARPASPPPPRASSSSSDDAGAAGAAPALSPSAAGSCAPSRAAPARADRSLAARAALTCTNA